MPGTSRVRCRGKCFSFVLPDPYCKRCPFDKKYPDCDLFCITYLDRTIDAESVGSLAGLIVEPYQGTSGFIFPPDGYLKKLEEWAIKRNLLFVLDEVQSSFGRTGKMWTLEYEKLDPDILCLGKGIGSGVPIAAVVTRAKIISSLKTGEMIYLNPSARLRFPNLHREGFCHPFLYGLDSVIADVVEAMSFFFQILRVFFSFLHSRCF